MSRFGAVGSGTLVRNWLRLGLIDEVVLMVCPVLVGAGKRIFEDGRTTNLERLAAEQFPRGVIALTYVSST